MFIPLQSFSLYFIIFCLFHCFSYSIMFSPYFWQLGGTQSDNNLFPDVDSSWKVCKQCHLSSGYLLFFFFVLQTWGMFKKCNDSENRSIQPNCLDWFSYFKPKSKVLFFSFSFFIEKL